MIDIDCVERRAALVARGDERVAALGELDGGGLAGLNGDGLTGEQPVELVVADLERDGSPIDAEQIISAAGRTR